MAALLHWRDFSAGRPYHAAFVPIDSRRRPAAHSHADFHELLYVTGGSGTQRVGGQDQPLVFGDLVLVRPHDQHDFAPTRGGELQFINVAFASERWHAFLALARVTAAAGWEAAACPVIAHRAPDDLTKAMGAALAGSRVRSRTIDLIRVWAAAIPALELALDTQDERPSWLVTACAAMYDEENLRAGLPRLREMAAVSAGHLARSMSAYFGCSPIGFVNRVRLDHSANLLASTTEPISAVADRCGYSSHAYFCAKFHERFGLAPRDYRDAARRAVVP